MHDGTTITLRQYLMAKVIEKGHHPFTAARIVARHLRQHPRLNPNETGTYATFEARRG